LVSIAFKTQLATKFKTGIHNFHLFQPKRENLLKWELILSFLSYFFFTFSLSHFFTFLSTT